jgi:hypothetical protein
MYNLRISSPNFPVFRINAYFYKYELEPDTPDGALRIIQGILILTDAAFSITGNCRKFIP